MSGIEVFQPGGTGDQNSAGAVSPGPLQVAVGIGVYAKLVGVADQPSTWAISTKPTGSAAAFVQVGRPGFTFSREFSPDKGGTYVLQVTGTDLVVYSVTVVAFVSLPGPSATAVDARQFGVQADGRKLTDGVLLAGSNVLQSTTANFTQDDKTRLVVMRTPVSPLPTGTVSISTAGPPYAITGSGTQFTTDIPNTGGAPDNGGAVYVDGDWFTISNVNTNTSLSVNQPASHNASGKTLYRETQIATTILSIVDSARAILGATAQVSGSSVLVTIATDDTDAVDATNNAAFASGAGEAVYPAGIIGVTRNLSYQNKTGPLSVRGQGKDKTFFTRMRVASENLAPTGNGYGMLSFDTCSGVTLRDFSLDGSVPVMGMSLSYPYGSQKGISSYDTTDLTISHVGSGGFGTRDEFIYNNPNVDPTKTANLRIEDCTILTSYVALNPATRSNMIVRGNRCIFGAVGLELQASHAVVDGNSFQLYNVNGYATGGQFAIIDPITGCNYLITGNTFGPGNTSTAGNAAVAIDGVTSATDCVVTLCGNSYVGIDGYFYNADSAIVRVANGCKGSVTIVGETFDRNTAGASGGTFIGVDGANTEKVTIGPCVMRGRAGSNMTRGVLVKAGVPTGAVIVSPGSVFGESVTTRWDLNAEVAFVVDRVHQFAEITDPAAPAVNEVKVYARDTGGKTELVARFNTGAVQRLAIEP